MTDATNKTNFDGLRVIAFESRRAAEMKTLIENQGGVATVVPSMREVELEENPEAGAFERALFAGEIDVIIFLTGVGTRLLAREIETRVPREQLIAALSRTTVVARGPKPVAALRDLGVPVAVRAPEPNTWRELLSELDAQRDIVPLSGRRVALQEYGMTNRALVEGLEARGAQVVRVPVYRWALPEDTGPLRQAVEEIAAGGHDVALFTTSTQIWHLFQIASEVGLTDELRQGLRQMVIASIGPTCSEALHEHEVPVDFEPEHPRMGHLVKYAAECSRQLLAAKQASPPSRCL
ncbi:MAG: uroporphyrinogen-III synthase [Armatimonadota bacterium]|nr:uroporphyrinogen-III synthase [Armatimonadota bacterium]